MEGYLLPAMLVAQGSPRTPTRGNSATVGPQGMFPSFTLKERKITAKRFPILVATGQIQEAVCQVSFATGM